MHLRSTSNVQLTKETPWQVPSWAMAIAVVGAVLILLLPIVLGSASLFFRDVLNFHWPAKVEQTRAWRDGVLPFVDLWRAGGQPGIGNLNTLPLYPDNLLLFATGSSLRGIAWAFNAHFWLHLAFAPLAFFWMARGLGLRREGSWMGAVLFGTSGFAVSMLAFYNMVAALVLVPSLIGALVRTVCIRTERPQKRAGRWALFVALALSWALLLVAGDPTTAVLGLVAGLVCVVAVVGSARGESRDQSRNQGSNRSRVSGVGFFVASGGLLTGTLIAWPQLYAVLEILEGSVRATLGYSSAGILRGSWHPALLADSVLPFFLGAPNQLFWGTRFHAGAQPLFYTFFPGVLALVLGVLAAVQISRRRFSRRRSASFLAGLVLVGLGLFVALGSFNPLVAWFSDWVNASWLRFPVKFWWWVVLGVGLVGGHAFDELLGAPRAEEGKESVRGSHRIARIVVRWASLGFGLINFALIVSVAFGWFLPAYEALIGGPTAAMAAAEALPRVLLVSSLSLVLCALLWVMVGYPKSFRQWGWAALVGFHVVTQMVVLRPLYPTLPMAELLTVPEILQDLSPTAVLTHGSVGARFGAGSGGGGQGEMWQVDQMGVSSLQRSAQRAGYPSAGVAAGYRYQLNPSPEGLDSYLPGLFGQVLKRVPDAGRVRLLEAVGVTHLVVERPVTQEGLVLERRSGQRRSDMGQGEVFRYSLPDARPIFAATEWVEFASSQQALEVLLGAGFDPRTTVLVPSEGDIVDGTAGKSSNRAVDEDSPAEAESAPTVEQLEADRHGMRLRIGSRVPTVIALDRTYLPGYRATIDGEPVPTTQANLVRLAVRVPAGDHVLVVRFEQSGWRASLMVSALGWLLLLVGSAFIRWRY